MSTSGTRRRSRAVATMIRRPYCSSCSACTLMTCWGISSPPRGISGTFCNFRPWMKPATCCGPRRSAGPARNKCERLTPPPGLRSTSKRPLSPAGISSSLAGGRFMIRPNTFPTACVLSRRIPHSRNIPIMTRASSSAGTRRKTGCFLSIPFSDAGISPACSRTPRRFITYAANRASSGSKTRPAARPWNRFLPMTVFPPTHGRRSNIPFLMTRFPACRRLHG